MAKGKIQGISHITLICQDLERSAQLFSNLFGAVEVYSSEGRNFSVAKEKILLIGDLWIALMEGPSVERSYNHIAFQIEESDLPFFRSRIQSLGLERGLHRSRSSQEGQSLYFYDYDNHLFELHTGDLASRLRYYQECIQTQ